MSADESTADAAVYDLNRQPIAILRIFGWRVGQDCIATLSNAEASALGEAPVQLKEESTYEFELSNPAYRTISTSCRSSTVDGRAHTGILRTGSRCGRLELSITDSSGTTIGTCALQVISRKLDAKKDFREMLADIAQDCVDLVLDARSPVLNRLKADPRLAGLPIYQRYAFLRGFIESEKFALATRHIALRPHSRQVREEVLASVQRANRPTSSFSKYLARSSNRVEVPATHPLRSRLLTIPREVPTFQLDETFDTDENRFVKFALTEWAAFAREVAAKAATLSDTSLQLEALALASKLESIARHVIFSEVSKLTTIPHGSSVLQRKMGYREIYEGWLRFDSAAILSWDGLDDIYTAGTRDTAGLYEHWAFAQTLRCLFSLPGSRWRVGDLYQIDSSGLHIRLRRGSNLSVSGVLNRRGARFRVTVDYNRLFTTDTSIGSWTVPMRPDITVTVYGRLSHGVLPQSGRFLHLHLDAKYRIQDEDVANFSRSYEEGTDVEDIVRHKRDDILKMHAYRDAIRQSVGAFALFPGSETAIWHESSDYLPAIGAVPLRPGRITDFAYFLERCLDEMCAKLSL